MRNILAIGSLILVYLLGAAVAERESSTQLVLRRENRAVVPSGESLDPVLLDTTTTQQRDDQQRRLPVVRCRNRCDPKKTSCLANCPSKFNDVAQDNCRYACAIKYFQCYDKCRIEPKPSAKTCTNIKSTCLNNCNSKLTTNQNLLCRRNCHRRFKSRVDRCISNAPTTRRRNPPTPTPTAAVPYRRCPKAKQVSCGKNKIYVCHYTGDTNGFRTRCINKTGVRGYLNKNKKDYCGRCIRRCRPAQQRYCGKGKIYICLNSKTYCLKTRIANRRLTLNPKSRCGKCISRVDPPPQVSLRTPNVGQFNELEEPLCIDVSFAAFNPASVSLAINYNTINYGLFIKPDSVCLDGVRFKDGSNNVAFNAFTTTGIPVSLEKTIYAGSGIVEVTLKNRDGSLYQQQALITAKLEDMWQTASDRRLATTGRVVFTRLPEASIVLTVKGSNGESGTAVVGVGHTATVDVTLLDFNAVSGADNKDLSQGLLGWVPSDSRAVSIVDHEEIIGPAKRPVGRQPPVNNDLKISNSRNIQNPYVSYTFKTPSSQSLVRVRYRFITAEVTSGYWGMQYNDYYKVSIRSETLGKITTKTDTMNAMGRDAFDPFDGSTNWREHALHVSGRDTVQVDVAVHNAFDKLEMSHVVVDQIKVTQDCRVLNSNGEGTCNGRCYTPRAQFVKKAIEDCFDGKYYVDTQGSQDSGNGMDVWPGSTGGGKGIMATGQRRADLEDIADWLMDYSSELKIKHVIVFSHTWDPSQDDMGVWADCAASRRCSCVSDNKCGDVTEGYHDHLHVVVL